MPVLSSGSEEGGGKRSVERMRVLSSRPGRYTRQGRGAKLLVCRVDQESAEERMTGEEEMRISSSKSRSRRASHNGKAPGCNPPWGGTCHIYMCVGVEYRHVCMPAFSEPRIKSPQPIEWEVNLSWAQKLHAIICKQLYASPFRFFLPLPLVLFLALLHLSPCPQHRGIKALKGMVVVLRGAVVIRAVPTPSPIPMYNQAVAAPLARSLPAPNTGTQCEGSWGRKFPTIKLGLLRWKESACQVVLLGSGGGRRAHILASSRRIFNEKQHLISLDLVFAFPSSMGDLSSHAVRRVSCAGSNAIVPNSSQYRTTDASVRIWCSAILPWRRKSVSHRTRSRCTAAHKRCGGPASSKHIRLSGPRPGPRSAPPSPCCP